MRKFEVDLIDDNYGCYFSIDSHDRKEYTVKTKTGILKRSFNDQWTSSSHELTGIAEAGEFMGKKINLKQKGHKEWNTDVPFKPGKLVNENQFILNSLQGLEVMEWKVIFRALRTRRIIIKNTGKERRNHFNHFSVLIKVRLKDHRHFIEVGEGNIHSPKFNQDGLISRVGEIIDNNKEAEGP